MDDPGALEPGPREEQHLAQVILHPVDVVQGPHVRHPGYADLQREVSGADTEC